MGATKKQIPTKVRSKNATKPTNETIESTSSTTESNSGSKEAEIITEKSSANGDGSNNDKPINENTTTIDSSSKIKKKQSSSKIISTSKSDIPSTSIEKNSSTTTKNENFIVSTTDSNVFNTEKSSLETSNSKASTSVSQCINSTSLSIKSQKTISEEKLPLVDTKSKALDKMLKSLDIKISGFKDIIPKQAVVTGGSISENVKTKYRAAKISLGPFTFQRSFNSYKKPKDSNKKLKGSDKKSTQSSDFNRDDEHSKDNAEVETANKGHETTGTSSAKLSQSDEKSIEKSLNLSKENEKKTESPTTQKKSNNTTAKKSPNKSTKLKTREFDDSIELREEISCKLQTEEDSVKKVSSISMEFKNISEESSSKPYDHIADTFNSSSQNENNAECLKVKDKIKRSKFSSLNPTKKVTKKKIDKTEMVDETGSTPDTGYSSFVSSKSDTQSEAAQSVDLSAKSVHNLDVAKEEDTTPKPKPKKGRPRKEISAKLITKSKELSKTNKLKKELSKIKDKITDIVSPKKSNKEHSEKGMQEESSNKTPTNEKLKDGEKDLLSYKAHSANKSEVLENAKITAQITEIPEAQIKSITDIIKNDNVTTSTTCNILTPVDMLSEESDSEAIVKAYITEIIKTVDDSEDKTSDESPSPKKNNRTKNSPIHHSNKEILINKYKQMNTTDTTSKENSANHLDPEKLKIQNNDLTVVDNKPKITTVRERLQQKYVTAFKFNSMVLPKKKETMSVTQKLKKTKKVENPKQIKGTALSKKPEITDIYDFKTESEDEENIKMNLLNESSLKMKTSIDPQSPIKEIQEPKKIQTEKEVNLKESKESTDEDDRPLKTTPKSSQQNTPLKQQTPKESKVENLDDSTKNILKQITKSAKLGGKSKVIKNALTKAKVKTGKSKWFVEISNSESDSEEDRAQKLRRKLLFMPKRRMASLNALAKVQCLYENESRTSNELGLSKTMQIPKIRTIASASSSDEEKDFDKKTSLATASSTKSKDTTRESLKDCKDRDKDKDKDKDKEKNKDKDKDKDKNKEKDKDKENEKEKDKENDKDKDKGKDKEKDKDKDRDKEKDRDREKEKDKEKEKQSNKSGKETPKKTDPNKETSKKLDVKDLSMKTNESSQKKSESPPKKLQSNKNEKSIIEIKSEDESEKSEEEVEVKRELRNVPGLRGVGKHWDFNESFESANESDISFYKYDGDHKPKNKTKKLKLKQKLAKIKEEKLSKTQPKLAKFKAKKLINNKISKLVKKKLPKIKNVIQKTKAKANKQKISQESESESDEDDEEEEKVKKESSNEKLSSIKNKKKLPFKKRKLIKHDEYLSTLKGLARKRMASLNASALVAATYELEGHLDQNLEELDCYEIIEEKPAVLTPKKSKEVKKDSIVTVFARSLEDDKEPKDMDIEEITIQPHKETEKILKERKDSVKEHDKDEKELESTDSIKDFKENSKDGSSKDSTKDQPTSRPTSSSVVIVQDTDVTITGVYVNATTGSSQEAYCKMQYRVQSSVTEERVVSNIEGAAPPKSYTPLGALSNMRPPGTNEGQQPSLIPSNAPASQTSNSSVPLSLSGEQHYPSPSQPLANIASAASGAHHHQHHHHQLHHSELNQLQHSGSLLGVQIEQTSPGSIYSHQQPGQNNLPPPLAPPTQLSAAQHLSHYGMPPPSMHHPQYDPTQQYQYGGPSSLSGSSHPHYQHSSLGPGAGQPPPQSMHHHPHYGPPLPPPPGQLQSSTQMSNSVTSGRCDSPTMQQQQHQYHSSLYHSNPPGGPPSGLNGSSIGMAGAGGSQSAFCAPNLQQTHQDLSGKCNYLF